MSPTSSPERANDHFVAIEGVVLMGCDLWHIEATQAGDARVRVTRPGSGQPRQDSDGVFEFFGEYVHVRSVLKPPCLLSANVFVSRGGEPNSTRLHRERSSRRISSASTRRSAVTSVPDA